MDTDVLESSKKIRNAESNDPFGIGISTYLISYSLSFSVWRLCANTEFSIDACCSRQKIGPPVKSIIRALNLFPSSVKTNKKLKLFYHEIHTLCYQ